MTPLNINQQIEEWLHSRTSSFKADDRPFITLSYAQSWDGSITTRCGETLSFSGEESMRLTHQLRSLHDGILVGIGTVLSDDPQLTVRQWSGSSPQPIILDSELRTPKAAKIFHHPDKRCWVLTVRPDANFSDDNVDVLVVPSPDANQQHVPLACAMSMLRERGIESLMIEGGATVITAFLRARLADALVLTIAPRLVGGYKAVGDWQAEGCDAQFTIHPYYSAPAGRDIVLWGDLQYQGSDQ